MHDVKLGVQRVDQGTFQLFGANGTAFGVFVHQRVVVEVVLHLEQGDLPEHTFGKFGVFHQVHLHALGQLCHAGVNVRIGHAMRSPHQQEHKPNGSEKGGKHVADIAVTEKEQRHACRHHTNAHVKRGVGLGEIVKISFDLLLIHK